VTRLRAERHSHAEAIAALRQRLAQPPDERTAGDLETLIALEQELDELDAGVHELGPAAVSEEEWDVMRDVGSGEELLAILIPDPRRRAHHQPPMSLGIATEIVLEFQAADGDPSKLAHLLLMLSRSDRNDLVHTLRRRAEERDHPVASNQSVAALLPLRIETRFIAPPPAGGSWTLQLRVFPEEVSLDREPGPPTAEEVAHTAAMWESCDGDLTGDEGRAAFRDLAGRVGGPRAAWLARSLPAGSGEAGLEERPRRFSRPRGLPPSLGVWLAREGDFALVERLQLDRDAIADDGNLRRLYTDVEDPDGPPPETWLTCFERAKDVGLAAEIDIGPDPEEIDAIYVTGLGEERLLELMRAHAAGGRLAVLAPGTPTNSVAGDPAADLGRDPDLWWELATGGGYDQPAVRALDLALCGGAHLGPLPGGDLDLAPAQEALSSALFPVLFGRALKDRWGAGMETWDLGQWARRCLAPQGDFPTIRVADQPYGVLPVTRLQARPGSADRRWVPHPADPPVEQGIVRALVELLPRWAAVAEEDGNVIGADTERLLGLLGRTPVSAAWARRRVLAIDLLRALGFSHGAEGFLQRLEQTWRREVEEGDPPIRRAVRRLIPLGAATWLPAELMGGPSAPAIRRMLDSTHEELLVRSDPDWVTDGAPAPLLARLVRHALVLTNAELWRLLDPEPPEPWRPPLMPPIETPERLAELAWEDPRPEGLQDDQRRIDFADLEGGSDIAGGGPGDRPIARIAHGWEAVRDGAEALASGELDEATLDRGLRALLDSTSHRLDPWASGVAARRLRWLQSRDAHWVSGAYGWVDAPRPFEEREGDDGEKELRPGPTEAGLLHAPSHAQALTAAILRDHAVRRHDTARWAIALDSKKVRAAERLAGEVRAGAHVREALGRLVEEIVGDPDGVRELRREPFLLRPEHEGRRVCDGEAVVRAAAREPASLPASVPAEKVKEIAELQDVLDTYADLLVADGVFDVVGGRPDRAAEAMEAAAGLGPPSDLRMLRTPREGTALSTVVLALLADEPPDDPTAPGAIADPLFAALLEHETGRPAAAAWRWDVAGRPVSLADLGLAPVDALTVPAGALAARVRAVAGVGPRVALGEPPALATARTLAELLGSQPGPPPALLDPDPPAEAAVATAAARDMGARIEELSAAAEALAARLETAPSPAAVAEAERWGIESDEGTVSERAEGAAKTLRERIDDEAAGGGERDLVARLRALAGAAALPAVWRVPRPALDFAPADGGRLRENEAPRLDEEWLAVMAAVRPALARLEAWQLARESGPWRAWSTHAEDPWRAKWLAANAADRKATPREQAIAYGAFTPSAHGGSTPFAHEQVGVVLLDRFAETVPSSTHATFAAFGFNGPKSRAPQSILVAVPPDVSEPLDEKTVVEILAETRLLARARMATPEALAAHRIPLPTTLLLGWRDERRSAAVDLEKVTP
jgi:hypothetical protein